MSATTEREHIYTRAAAKAYERLNRLTQELAAKYSTPLGARRVPESTRRGRLKRTAEDLADLLDALAERFGEDEVTEVLGLRGDDGRPIIQALVDEYGEETVARAFGLFAEARKRRLTVPTEELFLPEAG